MKPVVTLTLNPSIDGAAESDVVRPTHKIRTTNERYDPGGGGVNVARVIAELGRPALPVYLAGGATGAVLDELLVARGFTPMVLPIAGATRISHAVFERSTGLEYRFVPEGPEVTAEEWHHALVALEALDFDHLVASGSLPRGLPPGAFADLAGLAAKKGARLILDTSGPPLAAALAAGGIHLAKPSLGEFRALTGLPLETPDEIGAAARAFVAGHDLDMLAVTLGHDGAVLATAEGVWRLEPPKVPVHSATGAGDSFLGGMVWALAEGWSPRAAFGLGVAAGTAAVLTPGTELCRREDVWRLHGLLPSA